MEQAKQCRIKRVGDDVEMLRQFEGQGGYWGAIAGAAAKMSDKDRALYDFYKKDFDNTMVALKEEHDAFVKTLQQDFVQIFPHFK